MLAKSHRARNEVTPPTVDAKVVHDTYDEISPPRQKVTKVSKDNWLEQSVSRVRRRSAPVPQTVSPQWGNTGGWSQPPLRCLTAVHNSLRFLVARRTSDRTPAVRCFALRVIARLVKMTELRRVGPKGRRGRCSPAGIRTWCWGTPGLLATDVAWGVVAVPRVGAVATPGLPELAAETSARILPST
jgi:hypothetical protein